MNYDLIGHIVLGVIAVYSLLNLHFMKRIALTNKAVADAAQIGMVAVMKRVDDTITLLYETNHHDAAELTKHEINNQAKLEEVMEEIYEEVSKDRR